MDIPFFNYKKYCKDINYSLKLSKEFKPTISNLEQIIKSLLRSDLLEWEKIFNKIKNKNDIIDLVKLLNIFLNDTCKYKNNLKNISFNNLEKYMKSLSTNYFLNHEKFDFIINETIKNINLNGYLPLITTGLYIELNKIIENKF